LLILRLATTEESRTQHRTSLLLKRISEIANQRIVIRAPGPAFVFPVTCQRHYPH